MNKRKNKLNNFWKAITIIYILITIVFYISITKMNLLPISYLTIFSVAEIILTTVLSIGLTRNYKNKVINVICLVFVIIFSAIYIAVANYAFATSNFLGTVFQEVEETEDYYVVVRKDSSYQKLEDIKGEIAETFQITDKVKEDTKNKVSIQFKNKENLQEVGEDLIKNKTNVILIGAAQYDMLNDEIENFKENTRILTTISEKIETTETVTNTSKENKYTIENGVFNVYISGIDTAGKISKVSRSDANILMTVNTKTHEILLTSIPRDYYVTLHSKKAKDKLTHSGIYGINETVTTVEDLLGVNINYYVRVNFTTVIKLVDTLGGVNVYSDYNFSALGYHFNKGYNKVNGAQALAFSRERHSFAAGDNQRVKNQQHVIEAIINKVMDSSTILTKYTSILNSLKGSFQTNIKQDEISTLAKDQLNNMSSWTVKSNALSGTGTMSSTYSMGSQKLYVMIPSSSSVQEAKTKINEVMEK